ncbi:acetate--CoA ligase [Gayadomonas joobiniege]|uniref:acetate--CoA ligase n=1 Tax=Gayadomonas joobiniege TaxID=1234606 RepID=UPI0012DEF0F6|nr:acetate--CoA ligase [Gayadomonas joobiniege]
MTAFKGSELCQLADNTNEYLALGVEFDQKAIHGGSLNSRQFSLDQVKKTLEFICHTYRQDVRAKRQSRLHDAAFIEQNFELVPWYPELERARQIAAKTDNQGRKSLLNRIPENKILLTKYYAKKITGKAQPVEPYVHALYSLPYDEVGLTEDQAQIQKNKLTRFKYSRQQVMRGVIDTQKLAPPLIYVTEAALHDILLQGTAVVKQGDSTRYFNVDRNNGIDYDYAAEKDQQARYWYFREVPGVMGYGKTAKRKIQIYPQVTVAGDVQQLGLGKLIALTYKQDQQTVTRLTLLADEGGAFKNNLFQLDLMVGFYQGWRDYHAANQHLPDFVQAHILLLKDSDE